METAQTVKAKVEKKPLDKLVLNLRKVSKRNNKKKCPVLEIPRLAARIKMPENEIEKYEAQNCQLETMLELHSIMAKGLLAGQWRYGIEEKFVRELPLAYFEERLSKEELLMLCMSFSLSPEADMEKFREKDPDAFFFRKIYLNYWHIGRSNSWNSAVKAYNALKTLDFPELGPDFEVKFDASEGGTKRGYSNALRIFLDGAIGILLYFKGTHVLTISVDFLQDYKTGQCQMVRIQQIQCARKKGNRWLYRLPGHFLTYFAKGLYSHFTDHKFQVQIIRSVAAVSNIRNMYERNYLLSKKSWEEIRKMSETRYLEIYGDQSHKVYLYDNLKEREGVLFKFDVDIYRMLKAYSRPIPGLRRIKSRWPDYSILAPTG